MLQLPELNWAHLGHYNLLEDGHQLGTVSLLFEKIEDATIQQQLDRLARIKAENEALAKEEELKNWHPQEIKANTSIDEGEVDTQGRWKWE